MKYKLPIASEDTLGGIKVGEDFEINSETGKLNIKDMDTMQESLNVLSTTVEEGKALVAEAITDQGVETESDATFQTMHDNILRISGGVSQEYVDNADLEVKRTTAKAHSTKYDETVIPSQFTNKLYVYGNPESIPDNPNSYVAIDVISGDWYKVVNQTWVKQGTLDLNTSDIEANPEGEATETLNTIEIDGVIYGIKGGGGTEVEEKLYDNGTELVSWTVSSGNKNSDSISIYVGGGTFTHGAYTINSIDVTEYTKLKVKYMHNGITDEKEVDISAYTGFRYISFYYLTDSRHNECGIYLSETAGTFASGIVLSSTTGPSSNCVLYELSIFKQGTLDLNTSDIEANPEGEPTEVLEKIRIVNTIYELPNSGGETNSKIITIPPGNGTSTKTFTFPKTPKKISVYYEGLSYVGHWDIIWGQPYAVFYSNSTSISGSGGSVGTGQITYGADNKSFTITGHNEWGAWNSQNGSGIMYVEYDSGSESKKTLLVATVSTSSSLAIIEYGFDTSNMTQLDHQAGQTPVNIDDALSIRYNSNNYEWEVEALSNGVGVTDSTGASIQALNIGQIISWRYDSSINYRFTY